MRDADGNVPESSRGEDAQTALSDDAVPICMNCAAALPPNAAYCAKCGRPVGMFSTVDPMQLIHSQGWAWQNAVRGRASSMAFWGIWLVFGPAAVLLLGALWEVFRRAPGDGLATLRALLILACETMYVVLLYRVTKNYIRHRHYRSGICGVCQYDLRHLAEPRCPECGCATESLGKEECDMGP